MGKSEVRRAVFLDRDGVLNRSVIREGKPYPPARAAEFQLYPDAVRGCERLKSVGFALIVVTNQPDVGRGTQQRALVEEMHRMLQLLIPAIDRIEVCYHGGEGYGESCDCRKPKPGMLRHAAEEMRIDLGASYLIGDRWRDVDCARAAGCQSVFIDCGYAERLPASPNFTVANFTEAVDVVLRETFAVVSSVDSSSLDHLPK